MPIDVPDTIDLVTSGPEGSYVLTICDHLDWSETVPHQRMLQTKVNSYLRFIECGQLRERFPASAGKDVSIRVLAQYEPDEEGRQFLARLEKALGQAGYAFAWRIFDAA